MIPVETNDAKMQKTSLNCKAKILVPLNVMPVYANFGQLERDSESQTRTLTITRGDGGPIAPEIVADEQAPYTAALREIVPGEKYELDVTVHQPINMSSLYGAIVLKTGVPEMPEDKINVMARMAPRLRAMPPNIVLRPEAAAGSRHRIMLIWSGEVPGRIVGAESTDPRLEVSVKDEQGRQEVWLTVPEDYTPAGTKYVTIRTNDRQSPQVRVPVIATGARASGVNQERSRATYIR